MNYVEDVMADPAKGRRVMIDFDGVIHSYTSGWNGLTPTDPPVAGAKEFLEYLLEQGYRVDIFTARALHGGGVEAVKKWLADHDFPIVEVTATKYGAEIYIDDRGYRFEGTWDELYGMFEKGPEGLPKPWHGQMA
jgi:hypothetical protein